MVIFIIVCVVILFCVILLTYFTKSSKRKSRKKSYKRYYCKRSAKWKGNQGENIVASKLGGTIAGQQYLINDLIISDNEGHTSQIDHIFINKYGIWVIETKNYSGKIYGNANSENWLQVLAYGKEKNEFYNPVKQNKTHIYRLRKKIGASAPVKGVVVFIKADISKVWARNVYHISKLKKVVWSYTDECLTVEQMEEYYSKLLELKQNSTVTKKEHIKNIHKTLNDVANNICPRCGGKLVVRNGKNGKFYGCSSYPRCEFTKNI
ncbi:MAG: NERD domain-containing protein [Clostridia bacterium]|jgi:hypothetical protein|nr:NERD domain-containing protein [Clostridia bacterium]